MPKKDKKPDAPKTAAPVNASNAVKKGTVASAASAAPAPSSKTNKTASKTSVTPVAAVISEPAQAVASPVAAAESAAVHEPKTKETSQSTTTSLNVPVNESAVLPPPIEMRHGVEVQRIAIPRLIHALDRVHEWNRTALVLDPSGTIATFFKYAKGVHMIDAKAFVVQMAKKEKSVEQILQELRATVVMCLKLGVSLVLNFGNAATDFLTLFCATTSFPTHALFEPRAIELESNWKPIFREEEMSAQLRLLGPKFEALEDDTHSRILGFRVICLSSFEFADYEEFLSTAIPLEKTAVIVVAPPS